MPKLSAIPAVRIMQEALARTRDSAARAQIKKSLSRIKLLYGIPEPPDTARDLDLKRREAFVAARHPVVKNKKVVPDDILVQ